ncbi:hypothetical protein BC829DRAFT_416562 [Chytridium lagenaria]|nr:hypothetical protein BC829DRAFT_416562 [Chytridium lagenaria]
MSQESDCAIAASLFPEANFSPSECCFESNRNRFVECLDDRIQLLSITGIPLRGGIPKEISRLSSLMSLRLRNTSLPGIIPPEIGRLVNLFEIRLSNNQLTGPIPKELENNVALMSIYFDNNRLSGEITVDFGKMNKPLLRLENNYFSGRVPASVTLLQSRTINGNCFNVEGLSGNSFSNLTQRSASDCNTPPTAVTFPAMTQPVVAFTPKTTTPPSENSTRPNIPAIAGAAVGVLVVVLLSIFGIHFYKKSKRQQPPTSQL